MLSNDDHVRLPTVDPQPGDVVLAAQKRQTVERRVRRRDGYNIYYESSTRNGLQMCWITTWQDWCAKHHAEVIETGS